MPLQNNCSKALFSIPEVAEEEEEEYWEHVPNRRGGPAPEKKTEEKVVLEGPPFLAGRASVPVGAQPKSHQRLLEQPLPGASMLQECRRGLSQESRGGNPRETRAYPEPPGSWTWEGEEKQGKPAGGGRASQWRRAGRSQASPRKKAASREQGHSTLGPSHPQAGGGLYRAHSLKENLDVISSLGEEDDTQLYSWARPRTHPRRGATPAACEEPFHRGLLHCPSPESLEIDVEYDSDDEQDLTITSTLASQLSSDGRADGSPTDCEEDGWSDCSSRSGSVLSSGLRELRRCSSWEDESTEWSGSPSHSPGHPCRAKRTTGSSEERSRSLERSPSLWRAVPEHPGKGRTQLPAPAWVRELPLPASVATTLPVPPPPLPRPQPSACRLLSALPHGGLRTCAAFVLLGVAFGVFCSVGHPWLKGPHAAFLFSGKPEGELGQVCLTIDLRREEVGGPFTQARIQQTLQCFTEKMRTPLHNTPVFLLGPLRQRPLLC